MKKILLGLLVMLFLIALVMEGGCTSSGLSKEELIQLYSDGKYDLTYQPLNFKKIDLTSLTQFVRPVVPALIDGRGNAVVAAQTRAIGILWDQYIITSAGLFDTLPPNPSSQLHLGAILIWDVLPGGLDEFETLEIVFTDKESGVALLQRSPFSRFPLGPKEFPYKIGNSLELKEFVALVGTGHNHFRDRDITGLLLPTKPARLSVLPNRESRFGFIGSITHYDLGGPLFALRDGEPEFIGIVSGSWLIDNEESRGIGVTAERLFSAIKEKTGGRK